MFAANDAVEFRRRENFNPDSWIKGFVKQVVSPYEKFIVIPDPELYPYKEGREFERNFSQLRYR